MCRDYDEPVDSVTAVAARALAAGDPLGALNRVALRDDAHALALRGIAMAQLSEFERARTLLRRAARAFGRKQATARARCVVAEAEIALASRDLSWPVRTLATARNTLEAHGDRFNAVHARQIEARRLLLIGCLDEAEQVLFGLDADALPPALRTIHELAAAGIAIRRIRAKAARDALIRAGHAANEAGIPALTAEVEATSHMLDTPAARLIAHGEERYVVLEAVEDVLQSKALVVDACRYVVRDAHAVILLTGRAILFTLAQALAEAWPDDVPRETLINRAFRAKTVNETHRARLRVEIGRLRAELGAVAGVDATERGFELAPHGACQVVVLAQPVENKHAAVLSLLADGESWSTSALAVVLGISQRTVQRALDSLAESHKVESFGRGRARRWVSSPVPGFTTNLLLPAPLP